MGHNYTLYAGAFRSGKTHRQQLVILYMSIQNSLQSQCFWGYPPPMVDEGHGGLELYRRYKYSREQRKYFRNCERRNAANLMVKFYLIQKGYDATNTRKPS